MKKTYLKIISFAGLLLSCAGPIFSATYYLSPNGNDNTGDGTSGNPWRTAAKAFAHGGGNTYVFKDGTYDYSGSEIENPPSGSAGTYTVVMAENDDRAILKNLSNPIVLSGKSFIRIEGFTVKDGRGSHAIYITQSNHVKLLRIGVKNGVSWSARYGNVVELSESTTDCLLEDVWVVGAMRYGIFIGGTAGFSQRNILRRCVVRFDGGGSSEPKAGITNYGATDGIDGARNNLVQNCIAIDFNSPNNPSGEGVYAGFYNPHSATDIRFYGCIALKTQERGWLLNEDSGSDGNSIYNSVVWGIPGDGIATQRSRIDATVSVIDQTTVGQCTGSGFNNYNGAVVAIQNSLFYGNLGGNSQAASELFNSFYNNPVSGLNNIISDPLLKYIARIESNSPAFLSGLNGATRGATIVKRYGASGALWGEPGYDALTSNDLWPWPHEHRIHDLFAEADGNGDMPGNNEARGFAAPNMTLTKYIWEYLGNPNPYASTPAPDTTRPGISSVSAASQNTVLVNFTEPVEELSAETGANYGINNVISVNSAVLGNNARTVTLNVSALVNGVPYTVTVNNVKDLAAIPNTVASGTSASFTFGSAGPVTNPNDPPNNSNNTTNPSNPAQVLSDPLKPAQKILAPNRPGGESVAQFGPEAVEIVIHDSSGNLVYNVSRAAGSNLTWDCKNFDGQIVASGVYLCKIKSASGETVYYPLIIVK